MLIRISFIAACLVLPIVWGWIVHALFRYLERQRFNQNDDEPIFPDYQI